MTHNASATADLILFNGRIRTFDPACRPMAAVACAGGKILAVGPDDRVRSVAGPHTEQIDLDGRLLLPGFTDAHIHFFEWAMKRQDLNLAGLSTLEALIDAVRRAAERTPRGRWILGQGWNETDWDVPQMPTREMLDAAAPEHPVLLWRCDLHLAVANSTALAAAGVGSTTPDPAEGRIERDGSGRPTGILRELAINLVRATMPGPSPDLIHSAYRDGISALHRIGITGIHDIRLMNDPDGDTALQAFSDLHRNGQLDLRCWVTLPGHRLNEAIRAGRTTGEGDDRLRIGHVKYFFDGGVGARTAWMIDPFLDDGTGMPMLSVQELTEAVETAEAAGLSVMVHAVGDRANRELIELFSEAAHRRKTRSEGPGPRVPHRIEHMQVVRPEDAARLSDMDIAVSVCPPNMILDINLIDRAMGQGGEWAYAFRRLIDTGAAVMFSSDCPVCDPSPLGSIHAAVTRQRRDGTPVGGWYPDQRVTPEEAIAAYTVAPARAHGLGAVLGRIAPNAFADMTVLSDDLMTMDAGRIADVSVDLTVFDGKVVYRRGTV